MWNSARACFDVQNRSRPVTLGFEVKRPSLCLNPLFLSHRRPVWLVFGELVFDSTKPIGRKAPNEYQFFLCARIAKSMFGIPRDVYGSSSRGSMAYTIQKDDNMARDYIVKLGRFVPVQSFKSRLLLSSWWKPGDAKRESICGCGLASKDVLKSTKNPSRFGKAEDRQSINFLLAVNQWFYRRCWE